MKKKTKGIHITRSIVEVEIGGKKLTAVLDTGSRRSYIRIELAEDFPAAPVEPFHARLGGEVLSIREGRFVSGMVHDSEGRKYRFSSVLFPAKGLGEENGKRIDVLFGAVNLEEWGTIIDESITPPRVDHRLLREGELVEL